MSVEKQFDFIFRLLKESATSVGIDIDKSGYGLLAVHNQLANLGQEFDEADLTEADALLRGFGKSEAGLKVLYALGEAFLYGDGWTWMQRTFEQPFGSDDVIKALGWASLEERSLCDFAISTGVASAVCADYVGMLSGSQIQNMFSSMGRKGALVRHAPMRNLRDWAIEKYKSGNWPSANKAAHDLKEQVLEYGRTIGAHLSSENAQKTIAAWFSRSG